MSRILQVTDRPVSIDTHSDTETRDHVALLNPSTIGETALAYRGYNVTNLGRSSELLAQKAYVAIVEEELQRYGSLCSDYVGKPVDLVARVRQQEEPGLKNYEEAIALISAMEVAQLRLLNQVHGIDTSQARLAFGYSLGELVALGFSGMFELEDMIRIPLTMARDCVALSQGTSLGVLFSRGPSIDENQVQELCVQVTSEQHGAIGVSAVLSPNTLLLIGQNDTVARFKEAMHDVLPQPVHLRINSQQWPPMHTPIIRQKCVPDRASVLMETLPERDVEPSPPVFSLATGSMSYETHSARETLRKWVDHPQRLWDAVTCTLAMNVDTVLHIGPEPNVIPATFRRLSENVVQQTSGTTLGSLGMRAVSGLARRPWLASLLPANTALLRAPHISQIILEDWLLENIPE